MEKPNWTPAELLQLSGGYWSACALHAGVKLAVFTHLDAEGLPAPVLAERLGADRRGVAMLLDALAAMGLLVKDGDRFTACGFASQYLSRTSPDYLGHIIMHHHHLMASWVHLDEAVRSGRPQREQVSHTDDATARESFELGMFNLAMLIAPRLVSRVDLAGRRRLLDLGGGPGTYAIQFCLHNPQLTAVVYDLPTTRPFAEQTIARFGLAGRIAFTAGDFDIEELPGRYDVAWLSHVLHGEGPADCAALLRKAVASLDPGGILLVQEFILDDSRDSPLFPALFSLNMLLGTQSGQSYSEGELAAMLGAAGLTDIRRLPLDLPNGAGVMVGTVPR
jgi:hypothetical protein